MRFVADGQGFPRRFGDNSLECIRAVALDPGGRVAFGGASGDNPEGVHFDGFEVTLDRDINAFLGVLSPDAKPDWVASTGGLNYLDTGILALAFDTAGALFAGGFSSGDASAGQPLENPSGFVTKLDASGEVVFSNG